MRKGSEPFHGIQGPRRRGYAGALAPALLLPWVFLAALKGFYLLEYTGRLRRLVPPPQFKIRSSVPGIAASCFLIQLLMKESTSPSSLCGFMTKRENLYIPLRRHTVLP